MEGKVETTFVFQKEAKNSIKYQELVQPYKVWNGVLYVQKATFSGSVPNSITLVIEWE